MIARSLLYVPGDKPALFDKAMGSGADAIILDLEDAVALARKDDARDAVTAWLRDRGPSLDPSRRPAVWVRCNAGERQAGDARAAVLPGLAGLYAAKVSTPEDVDGLAPYEVPVTALIETAQGIVNAASIARHACVERLAIGEADLCAELGIEPSSDEIELAALRTQIVVASAAAGIAPPVGPVRTNFRDADALARTSESLRRMGFGGRSAIHPAQVSVINAAFTPDAATIARAKDVIRRLDEAGGGVSLDAEGRMLDEAVVRAARRTLALAPDLQT